MNILQFETSPYLLQHKNNPVYWLPWNTKYLDKALQEEKLMIISIGYAACHWCHVMEHECFEDKMVADIMNENYISIKIDREERPDIDHLYMNASMVINGQGGWPLNVLALPNGKPIYAGTYFPKQQWMQLLLYFADIYKKNPEKLEEQANKITHGLHQIDFIPLYNEERTISPYILEKIWEIWELKIDTEYGGQLGAPKFMMPNNYTYLLAYLYTSKNKNVADTIKTTLKKMAFGGLHDILGGGFARYSVDTQWKVPHFEKMLYDNGQLLSVYAQAFQLSKRPMYKSVCDKILAWINREMTDESNGIYSSLDADSEGMEGKFYCWNYHELKSILKENFDFIKDVYSITEEGNFEHGLNVLFRIHDHEYFMEKYNLNHEEFQTNLETIHVELLKYRNKKIKPNTDDKILTEWNALFVKGCCDAYKAFGDSSYKTKAIHTMEFILSKCKKQDYRLTRNYKNKQTSINAFLQDYAFTIDALIALHQITLEENYLLEAQQFLEYVIHHFYNSKNGLFFMTSDIDEALIIRNTETGDNVIPSGNSTMAMNLLILGKYFENGEYIKMSLTMLNNVYDALLKNPMYYSNWAMVLYQHLHLKNEIVICGENALEYLKEINKNYLPNYLISGCKHESNLPLTKDRYLPNKTQIFICKNMACQMPYDTINEALMEIEK